MATVKDFITRYGVYVQGTNRVTSSTGQVGSLQVDGGAAIAKNLIVGETATIYGPIFAQDAVSIQGPTQVNNVFTVTGASTFNNNVTINGFLQYNGGLVLTNLTVTNLTVSTGGFVSNSTSTFNAPVNITGGNSLTVGTGTTTLGGPLNLAGPLTITDDSAATLTPSGALVVSGGIYAGKNLIVASTNANTGTKTSNALYLAGGAWIDKTLVVEGDAVFKSNVTFTGSATYVLSTNTVYTDNMINLHIPPDGITGAWTIDDGKDIGFVFHNYKGADNDSFLGWANDSGYLEWYGSGLESNGTFTNATYGIFKTGGIILVNTNTAQSTTTGALQVAGGIGVAKDIYAGGDISGATLTARNLTQGRIVFAGAGGQLTDDAELTYDALTNLLSADVSKATTATNLAGGGPGQIPYQSNTGITAFVATGTNGYILQSNATGAPTWVPLTGVVSGAATTASNVAGGTAGQLVYQISPGITGFAGPGNAGQILISNGTNGPVYVNTGNVYVGSALKANAIFGGSAGFIPMQIGTDQTAFIEAGTTGQLLQSNGSTATFVTTTTIYVGRAVTADRWTEARTVTLAGDLGGSATFDGSTNFTITATIQPNSVELGTDTTGNYVAEGATAGFGLSGSSASEGGTFTVTINSTSSNTPSTVVFRDATGSFSAGDIFSNGFQVITTSTVNQFANQTFITAGTDTAVSTSSGNIVIWNTSTLQSVTDRGASTTNAITITNNTSATSTNTGALKVAGGVGIGGALFVGDTIKVGPTVAGSVVPAIYSNNVILASYTSPTITTTATVNLDVYNASEYRTARYTVQLVDGGNIHTTEIMVTHNGATAYINEYGIITNNGQLGNFDASLNGGNITLNFTPTIVSSMVIKVARFSLTA